MKGTTNKKERRFLAQAFSLLILLSLHADFVSSLAPQYTDNWDTVGSIYDSIFWEESSCPAGGGDSFIVIGMQDPINTPIAYCVNNNRLDDGDMDFCLISNLKYTSMCSGVMPATYFTGTTSGSNWFESDELLNDGAVYQDVLCGEEGNLYSQNSPEVRRGQIQYFRNNSGVCSSAGVSANSASYDYYIIDSIYHSCPSDGASSYYTKGTYGTGSVDIELTFCPTGKICDADHDAVYSYVSTTIPTTPCKLEEGEECSATSDCWNDLTCGGAKTRYRGLCDGSLVDLDTLAYPDSCGSIDAPPNITGYANNQDCSSDGGFPSGYRCDDLFDNSIETSIANVYNSVCKAGEGNSCSVDSDCYHDLDCVGGICAYDVNAIFTTTVETGNIINKSDTESFLDSLSTASDNDIKFSCWNVDGINIECNGDATQCSSQCSGATNPSSTWDDLFTYTFNSGGDITVLLTIGSVGKYSDTYSEDYCVSGDGNYCYSCVDGWQNDDEIDVDWGGHCGYNFVYKCNNRELDSVTNETSIDYGGACGNCDNTSIYEDAYLSLLIESNEISYPFDDAQCEYASDVESSVVMIVLLLSGLLLAPFALLIIILLVILISITSTAFGSGIAFIGRKTLKKLTKRRKKGKL